MTIKAAGLLLIADGRVLLLKRNNTSSAPGFWAFPGGHVEPGETLIEAACRECREETGWTPTGNPKPFDRSNAGHPAVDFTTFVLGCQQFIPQLNDEHTEYAWCAIGDYPAPLHPGVAASLKLLDLTELKVAEGVRDGVYPSPSRYENVTLFNIRISGTGVSYRDGIKEFVYRPPEQYLTEDFLKRCYGLPVIVEHPDKAVMDSNEFENRIVGTIILPFIRGDEVWGIAKIYDDAAVKMLSENQLSTSPTVFFRTPAVNSQLDLGDGQTLLIERNPSLVDHVAICEQGVWDKMGAPKGVELTNGVENMDDMTAEDKAKKDAEEKMMMEDKAKKDSDGLTAKTAEVKPIMDSVPEENTSVEAPKPEGDDKLDRMLAMVDSMCKRMDSIEARYKSDATIEDKDKRVPEKEEPPVVNNEEDKFMSDEIARKEIEELKKKLPKEMTTEEEEKYADEQAKADAVYHLASQRAPRWHNGETLRAYMVRLAGKVKHHSEDWKAVDLGKLDPTSFNVAQRMIYADAQKALRSPASAPHGTLRQIIRKGPGNRDIFEFVGDPAAWMDDFKMQRQTARITPRHELTGA